MLNRSFHRSASSRHSGGHSARESTSSPFPRCIQHINKQTEFGRDDDGNDSDSSSESRRHDEDDDSEVGLSPSLSPPYQYGSSYFSSRAFSSPSPSSPRSPSSSSSISSSSSPPVSSTSPCVAPSPPFQWAKLSLSALLSSVQSKLPFLSSKSAASAISCVPSKRIWSAGKRKRSHLYHSHHSQQAPSEAEESDSVVIDVRSPHTRHRPSSSSSRYGGRGHSGGRHERQSSASVKKRRMLHVLVVGNSSDQHTSQSHSHSQSAVHQHSSSVAVRDTAEDSRLYEAMRAEKSGGFTSAILPSTFTRRPALFIDQPTVASISTRPALPHLPVCFPALDKLASSVARGDVQSLSDSAVLEVEADVYSSLNSVDRAIQCELHTLLTSNGHPTAPQGTLSFRQLVLRVLDASSSDRRLRRLCAVEPQWALYVLEALTVINHGRERQAVDRGRRQSESQQDKFVEEKQIVLPQSPPRSAAPVRRRTASSCGTVRETRLHRRATSDGAVAASRSSSSLSPPSPTLSPPSSRSSSSAACPPAFSLFLSSSSGISYSLRCHSTESTNVAAASSSAVRSFLASATSIHVLLASLFYLSLLHTTDSACLRKSHFALALLHHSSFQIDRPRLPLSHPQSVERTRRVASREKEYCRELYCLFDSCCLTLIQHDLLPALPFATFDQHTLPPLPVAHELGLR